MKDNETTMTQREFGETVEALACPGEYVLTRYGKPYKRVRIESYATKVESKGVSLREPTDALEEAK